MKSQQNISYLPLIEKWEQFLKETKSVDVQDFAQWVISRKQNAAILKTDLQRYFDLNTNANGYSHLNSEASYLIFRLSKFLKHYTKPIFQKEGLTSQDEFAILAHVQYLRECTKKAAIHDNILDPTTGIDMIRRLVKRNLLKERTNKTDKREKLISITTKGEQTLKNIYEGFTSVQEVMVNMSDSEKNVFVTFLKRLDEFHGNQYEEGI